ncbi:MAG: NahK/ErcS family hybrid sensor histidine kinase/response regulator, partial [Hyphomicrobiaceae bacterium]
DASAQGDMAGPLLIIRRLAIVAILIAGYGFYKLIGTGAALASIGLVSFAGIAQLAPAFFVGLVWRKATARGAIAGMVAGIAVWAYTLMLPWFAKSGWLPPQLMTDGPFGLGFLAPQALFYLRFDPLTHGVIWSLFANIVAYVTVSLLRPPEPVERLQAHVFVVDDQPRQMMAPSFRIWRTSVTTGDLQTTVARYLGAERAERSFKDFAASRNVTIDQTAEADVHTLRFTEHLLTSAIGAASARLVLTLLLRRGNMANASAMRLLDDASEALQYNRDLLQSALDQVRHGLSVFDKDMRLVCWNRQFRELLDLPPELGRVGVPLDKILKTCAQRGDLGAGSVDEIVADRLMRLAVRKETFVEHFRNGRRILEIRTASMPQGGVVTTYADITERMTAADALERANETLERRVEARTLELVQANSALEGAKKQADAANLDKTRFLAAASHDVLQPLNAARLYASSLVERLGQSGDDAQSSTIVNSIDSSLEAVEEILGALIDIARLDTGRMEPEISDFPLNDMIERLRVEFEPMAKERGLSLKVMPTSVWVRSDRRLLRRLLQNFVSNAIKYTREGGVVLGVRRDTGAVRVEVYDTGPGIPAEKRDLIFKEFQRLEETATSVRGLGLGLSIVERIGKVLKLPVTLRSTVGRGSMFGVRLPRVAIGITAQQPTSAVEVIQSRLAGLSVLCIDNDPTILRGMQTLLGGWGCHVTTAASGEAALRGMVETMSQPDVLLVDFHLDTGSGIEAIAIVRGYLGQDVPAIIITADNSAPLQRLVRDGGFGLLRKPVKAAALRAALTQISLQAASAAE